MGTVLSQDQCTVVTRASQSPIIVTVKCETSVRTTARTTPR